MAQTRQAEAAASPLRDHEPSEARSRCQSGSARASSRKKKTTISAYQDGISARRADIDRRLVALQPRAGQIGLALVRGGAVQQVELFGSAGLYARAWRKIGRGVLADPTAGGAAACGAAGLVAAALRQRETVSPLRQPAPGGGETLPAEGGGFVLGALVRNGAVYHPVAASTAGQAAGR